MISACMDDRARRASREHNLSTRLNTEWNDNQADMYTLDEQDLTSLWISLQTTNGKTDEQIIARFEELTGDRSLSLGERSFDIVSLYGATAISAGRDGHVLTTLTRDMHRSGNALGRMSIRPHNGRKYVVFKGNHRLRQVIRGTRYSLANPTIIRMGIGTDGVKGAARGSVYVTIVVSASVNSYAWIFDESFGWQDFLSNISADLVKAAIAIVLGAIVAKKMAAATGMLVLAKAGGFLVGITFGVAVARITWSDVGDFAQRAASGYIQAVESLSNPSQFLAAQRQKVSDFAYCTMEATGSVIIDSVQREVEARVSSYLRRLSPLNIW